MPASHPPDSYRPAAAAAVAVSAPGKVLLAGGYLVLDRAYTGLVFGLDARMHVHVQPLLTSSGVALEEILVRSPQFRDASWEYGYRFTEGEGGIQLTQLRRSSQDTLQRNPFVETTLSHVLTYISTVMRTPIIPPAIITILADNAYYTQPTQRQQQQKQQQHHDNDKRSLPRSRFANFAVPLASAHKTGLGSSAALVTALTAALLRHYLPKRVFDLDTQRGKRRLHNLAQIAHCAAQGKVGSGFDVACAVYGSCLYRRFSPEVLDGVGRPGQQGFAVAIKALVEDGDGGDEEEEEEEEEAGETRRPEAGSGRAAAAAGIPPEFDLEAIEALAAQPPHGIQLPTDADVVRGSGKRRSEGKWDAEIHKGMHMPKGLRLVMCDVDCGSQTPGMVKRVLEWRRREPDEADMLWRELHRRNEALADELTRAARPSLLDGTADGGGGDGVKVHLGRLTAGIARVRELVRDMTRLSGVPVEPEGQTRLLDGLGRVDGVVGGVVPGAGGFDAVVLVVEDREGVGEGLRSAIEKWNRDSGEQRSKLVEVTQGTEVGKMSTAGGRVSILDVREDGDGVKEEDPEGYEGWIGSEDRELVSGWI